MWENKFICPTSQTITNVDVIQIPSHLCLNESPFVWHDYGLWRLGRNSYSRSPWFDWNSQYVSGDFVFIRSLLNPVFLFRSIPSYSASLPCLVNLAFLYPLTLQNNLRSFIIWNLQLRRFTLLLLFYCSTARNDSPLVPCCGYLVAIHAPHFSNPSLERTSQDNWKNIIEHFINDEESWMHAPIWSTDYKFIISFETEDAGDLHGRAYPISVLSSLRWKIRDGNS